jgi:hypothetical protein
VKDSAEALSSLRDKVDTELWKGVLKAEASLVDKERSLNEVQAKREQLWGEREAIVSAMRAELGAEQQRAARAWSESWSSWEKVQADHEALRKELHERRVATESAQSEVVVQMGTANATLKAEVGLLEHERQACREERSALSVALLTHKTEVSKHREWLTRCDLISSHPI